MRFPVFGLVVVFEVIGTGLVGNDRREEQVGLLRRRLDTPFPPMVR